MVVNTFAGPSVATITSPRKTPPAGAVHLTTPSAPVNRNKLLLKTFSVKNTSVPAVISSSATKENPSVPPACTPPVTATTGVTPSVSSLRIVPVAILGDPAS